nr:MAG TPA: Endodeoxyribonuclease RusA [Caudoviricetes sp.]
MFIHRELPKSRPKRLLAELDTAKPDIDNVTKAVLDALNGVAYDDDKQVVSLRVTKLPRTRQESFLRVTIIGG